MRASRALLLFGLVAAAARADEGAESRFFYRSSFDVRSALTDNAFLTSNHEDRDLGFWLEPRLELGYRIPAAQIDADLGAQVPRYLDHGSLNDTFWRARLQGEAGLWPGFSVRLSDAYTPQPIALGAPDDATPNLAQTNRAEGELRYWREFNGGRELTVGVEGARFDSDKIEAFVPGSGGGAVFDSNFRPDYSEAGGFAEVRNPLNEDNALLFHAGTQYRSYDALSQGEYLNAEGTVGLESRLPGGLQLALAGGFGWLDSREGGGAPLGLGRATLTWQATSDLRVQLGFHHQITSDLAGNDFVDTTGRVTLEKYFGLSTAASVTAFMSNLDSQSSHPSHDLFGGAELVLRHQLSRNFQVAVSYRYWDNGGSFDADNFRQNQASLTFSYRQ